MGLRSRWVVAGWSNGSRYIVLAKHGRPNHMATHSRPNDVCFIYFFDGNAMVWQLTWGSLYVYGSFLSTISPIYYVLYLLLDPAIPARLSSITSLQGTKQDFALLESHIRNKIAESLAETLQLGWQQSIVP